MQEHDGTLLIGGARLEHVHCELEKEVSVPNSDNWILAGHLHVTPKMMRFLEFNRRYLLRLDDGRFGAVALTRVLREDEGDVDLEFQSNLPR